MSYFSEDTKRQQALTLLGAKRVIRAGFRFPLGIVPEERYLPDEGYIMELVPREDDDAFGDRYYYGISVSVEKLVPLIENVFMLFPDLAALIVERYSEDVNREKDVFVSQEDVEMDLIRNIFSYYQELWIECGFVGFGAIHYASGIEVFINDHKVLNIFVPQKYVDDIDYILDVHGVSYERDLTFSYNYEHWHYSLAGRIHEVSLSEDVEYQFDYYDIINELKLPLNLELVISDEEEFKVLPRWWYVVVRGLDEEKEFVKSYYLVAETEEEMETVIADDMEKKGVAIYQIFDKCNVNPSEIDHHTTSHANTREGFSSAKIGIWDSNEVVISDLPSR